MAERDYSEHIEIVEAAMDWIARRWTKSMMKRELREWFPNLSASACEFIFSAARKEIIKRFNIDPKDYKGKQLTYYEFVIRTAKVKDALTAAERIDKLLGLEHLTLEDADVTASKIREALKEAKNKTVGVPEDVRSENERKSKANAESCVSDGLRNGGTSETKDDKASVDNPEVVEAATSDSIPKEVLEELNNLKAEELEGFIKKKKYKPKTPEA